MYNLETLKPLAARAWSGTSFSPERRGETFIREHSEELTADLETIPEDRREWYAQKYVKLCGEYLSSHSNVVSAMIAGPSNFPSQRMRKRSDWADNKYAFFREWRTRVLEAIQRSKRRAEKAAQGPEIDQQRKKLAQLKKNHEQMLAANKILRNKKTTEAEKFTQLQGLGWSDSTVRKIMMPDYMGRIGFPGFSLTNNNARIKHTEQRIRTLERREVTTPVEKENADGIRVVMNTPENRVQIFFPGKPEESVRTELKRHGFRWAPSNSCWQAYINNRSVEFSKQFTA